jgi:hypothetical protein
VPLDARGIVGPNQYKGGRFKSEDSRERADGTRGTIDSMRVMFQEYARDMEIKQAVVLKEIKESSAQLGERIRRVENIQGKEQGSGHATTARHDRGPDRHDDALPRQAVPRQLWVAVDAPPSTPRTERSFEVLREEVQ